MPAWFCALCCLLLVLLLLSGAVDGQTCTHWNRRPFMKSSPEIPLYVGAMFTSVEESTFAGSAESNLRPAVELAIRDIKQHPCVLNGYNMTLMSKDSQCKSSKGMKSFFDMINDQRLILAIFGGACTITNQLVAMATNYWHKVQLSYAEDHPMFATRANQDLYGTFYRIVPSDQNHIDARISFLNHFGWSKVSALVQNDDSRFALLMETFTTTLERKHNVKVLASSGFSTKKMNIKKSLDTLKAKDARIIVGEFSVNYATAVFCQAYFEKLYGPEYVWIIGGYHDENWWRKPSVNMPCSKLQLLDALDGHFAFEFSVLRSDQDKPIVSEKTVKEYLNEYKRNCHKPSCRYSNYHGYVYDGLWAIALAFEKVITDMLKEGMHFDPAWDKMNSTEGMDVWKQALMTALNELQYEGVTGRVRFRENERLGKIRIMQFNNQAYIAVGEYDAAVDKLYINKSLMRWRTGTPPADSIHEVFVRRYVEYSVFCVMCSVVAICVCVAFTLLSTNIYFRNHKYIKMSSPYINNLIILGSIMTYCSVILLGIDTRIVSEDWYGTICTAKVWTLSLGFTLSFGSMFSKTWRVHSIFTDVHLNKKAITDNKLYILVGVLLLLDATILIIWLIVDPMKLAVKEMPPEKNAEENVIVHPTIEHCKAEYGVVFQSVLYGYKGIMLVLGCFLAWETRNLKVPALNDSKYIGMSVYNVVLICAVGVAISFILHDQVNECYIIISMFIIFCTTLTLGLVFVPKIVELIQSRRNPGADHPRSMLRSLYQLNKSKLESKDLREKKSLEERENRQLKKRLNLIKRETAILVKIIARCSVLLESEAAIQKRRKSVHPVETEPYGGVYVGPDDYCTSFIVDECQNEVVNVCEAEEQSEANGLEMMNNIVTVQLVQSEIMPMGVVRKEVPFVIFHKDNKTPAGVASKKSHKSLEALSSISDMKVTEIGRPQRGSEPPSICFERTLDDSDQAHLLANGQEDSGNKSKPPRKFSLIQMIGRRSKKLRTSVSLLDAVQDFHKFPVRRKFSLDFEGLTRQSQKNDDAQAGFDNFESDHEEQVEMIEIIPSHTTN